MMANLNYDTIFLYLISKVGVILERLIDLSQMIVDDMPVYPGDDKTNLIQTNYLNVDTYNNHRLEISMHAGTHIDSPMHLTDSAEYISDSPLDSFIGNGCILDVRNQPIISIKPEYEGLIKANDIVLLYTSQDRYYGQLQYYSEHPVISMDFCELLLSKNIKMLGMDMPSPDQPPFHMHKLLLKAHIYLIENLTNLDKLLGVKEFEVIALPLKIKADSSMARVVARII